MRSAAKQLAGFLTAFFIVWSLRATILYSIDEAIASPVWRAAYSDLVKFALWVLPAAVFVVVFRCASPMQTMRLSAWPSARHWAFSTAVILGFLSIIVCVEWAIGGKSFSTTALLSLPLSLWLLQLLLSPLIEEILFRGFVLQELLALMSKSGAMTLTALLFIGVHLPYWLSHGVPLWAVASSAVGLFALSVVASWLFIATGSIWPAVAVHIANNILALALVSGAK